MPKKKSSRRAASAPAATERRSRRATPARKSSSGTRTERSRTSSRESDDARHPSPPYPSQHQKRPGKEKDVTPRPQYEAPAYRGSGKLDGKIALITGGDSGIGRAVAVLYAREGASIAIVHLPEEAQDAEETRKAVEAEGQECLVMPGDVQDPDFCDEIVARTVSEFGGLDVLVNNAAYQKRAESLDDLSDEQLERTFRTNIFAYMRIARAALRHMKEGAAIVNTGSITGLVGSKELLDYSATKGAIHAFTKSLAQNLAGKRIRVNCVSPGPVWTPLNVADKPPGEAARHGSDVPFERPAQPEEIAPAFVYFASNTDSSYATGEILTLLGGETTAG
jgi:NAD(P)-dependent dehydrogenase (short-subunit alcohol dehydrogenase family)